MSAILVFFAVSLSGCTIVISDPIDVPYLARYQHLSPGTPVKVIMTIGEQEGKIAWVSKDTLSLLVDHDGHEMRVNYAGRLIREIRVLSKEEPNRTVEPTSTNLGG